MNRYYFLFCGFFLFLNTLSAQENTEPESIFEALQYDDIVKVTIETDLDSLINVRRRESYQPARFIYKNKEGQKITRKFKIKPRGKFRRRICGYRILNAHEAENLLPPSLLEWLASEHAIVLPSARSICNPQKD